MVPSQRPIVHVDRDFLQQLEAMKRVIGQQMESSYHSESSKLLEVDEANRYVRGIYRGIQMCQEALEICIRNEMMSSAKKE